MKRAPERAAVRRLAAAWPLACLVLLAVVFPPNTGSGPATAATDNTSGLRIFLDPDSGAPVGMPPASALERSFSLDRALSRSSAGLVERRNPDGSYGVHLQGRFMSASVAHIDDQGRLHRVCTDDPEHARAVLRGETQPSCDHDHDPASWEVK